MKDIIVNWVKEDEELLEPYEWDEDDDLEIISRVDIYHVDEKTLHDFIYGCINIYDSQYFNNILINHELKKLPIVKINYHMYDEGLIKEYGLTRNERIKKQYVENMVDQLYVEDYDKFLNVCKQLEINDDKSIGKYLHLKKKLEKGYSFIHELLYNEFVKK